MKKIEFVRIKSNLCGFGLSKGSKYTFNNVEEAIQKRIEQGWDYCEYVPMETWRTGK